MTNSEYLIEQILRRNKITDYLDKKNIHPVGSEINGKYRYCCPIHKGDNDPSFMVYLSRGEHQNFFCYGCKARYNIIHLYKALEGVGTADAIKALSNGISIDLGAELDFLVEKIENDRSVQMQYVPAHFSLLLNRQLFEFKKIVGGDVLYLHACEKLGKAIDSAVVSCDLGMLEMISTKLASLLPKLSREYQARYEKH